MVAPGDRLFLKIKPSSDAFVYVVNEDEEGRIHLLFPATGLDKGNPLPGKTVHDLPGSSRGEPKLWQVDQAGGKERFLIVASRKGLAGFEAALAYVPPPATSDGEKLAAVFEDRVSDGLRGDLRGVGLLVDDDLAGSRRPGTRLSDLLLLVKQNGQAERSGIWIEQIVLDNPGP
jgi:hypothetical protein